MASDGLTECPGCKKKFKQISKHKCSKAGASNTAQTVRDTTASLRTQHCGPEEKAVPQQPRTEEQPGPQGCAASAQQNEQMKSREAAGGTDMASDGLTECPSCKKKFKQISKHKCTKAGATYASQTHRDTTAPLANTQQDDQNKSSKAAGATDMASDGLTECPGCKKTFKQISKHKCSKVGTTNAAQADRDAAAPLHTQHCGPQEKAVPRQPRTKEQPGPQDCAESTQQDEQNKSREAAGGTDMASDGLTECPGCKKKIKQISKHKCRKAGTTTTAQTDREVSKRKRSEDSTGTSSSPLNPSASSTKSSGEHRGAKNKGQSPAKANVVEQTQTSARLLAARTADDEDTWLRTGCSGTRLLHETDTRDGGAESAKEQDARAKTVKETPTSATDYSTLSKDGPEGNKPFIDIAQLTETAEKLREELGIQIACSPTTSGSDFFDKEVRLEQEEKNNAKYYFDPFRSKILERLTESTSWLWECFNSGSYYDGTKVTRPDEIDCMFHPKDTASTVVQRSNDSRPDDSGSASRGSVPSNWLVTEFQGAPPGYCFVRLRKLNSCENEQYKELAALCAEDGRISSHEYKKKIFKIFKDAVNDKRKASSLTKSSAADSGPNLNVREDPDSEETSPSYAVLLDTIPGKAPISVDLVPCLHIRGWHICEVCMSEDRRKTRACKNPEACFQPKNAPGHLSEDLIKFLTVKGYDVVPKPCKKEEYIRAFGSTEGYSNVTDLLWRLSFSRSEKRLTKYADGKIRPLMSSTPAKTTPDRSGTSLSSESPCTPAEPSTPQVSGRSRGSVRAQLSAGFSESPSSSLDMTPPQTPTSLPDDQNPSAELLVYDPSLVDTQEKSKGKKKDKGLPTCRKCVLRVLKRILEIIKGFDNARRGDSESAKDLKKAADRLRTKFGVDFKIEHFTTFQVRTLLWREMYVRCPGDELWSRKNRRSRLGDAITQLKNMVSGRMQVDHFFLPGLDIMPDITDEERKFLYIMFSVAEKLF